MITSTEVEPTNDRKRRRSSAGAGSGSGSRDASRRASALVHTRLAKHRRGLEPEQPGDPAAGLEHDDGQRHRGDARDQPRQRPFAPALRARQQRHRHGLQHRERGAQAGQHPGRARLAAEQRDAPTSATRHERRARRRSTRRVRR